MSLYARWVTSNGKRMIRVTSDGNPSIMLTPEQAWRLRILLDFMVIEPPPSLPDNDTDSH